MVSRNRIGRQDFEAWEADREDDSPWSEDQATTCYMPEDFAGVPGVVYGLPPLPRRFHDGHEEDQDSREVARVSAEPEAVADGGNTEWLDLQTSWDISPPRASGVARLAAPRTAAEYPNSRMDAAFEAERSEPSRSDWAAEFEAQLEAARSEHPGWWGGPAADSGAEPVSEEARHSRPTRVSGRRAPSRSGAYAPAHADVSELEEARQYAREQPSPAYPEQPAEAEDNPWQDEPYVHSLSSARAEEAASAWRHSDYAPTSRSQERRPAAQPASGRAPAARTQRQRPQRSAHEGPSQQTRGRYDTHEMDAYAADGAYHEHAQPARPSRANTRQTGAHRASAPQQYAQQPDVRYASAPQQDGPPTLAHYASAPQQDAQQADAHYAGAPQQYAQQPDAQQAYRHPTGAHHASAADYAYAGRVDSHYAAAEQYAGTRRSGATGQFAAPLPPRAAQPRATAARTMRARPLPAPPAPPTSSKYAFDDIGSNPFAPRRTPGRSKLFLPLLACAAFGALYFGGQLPRLAGLLQPEPEPVLRSTALPLLTPPTPPTPPAAEPVAAAPIELAAATPAPQPQARRTARKSKSYDELEDEPSTRRRSLARVERVEVDSEPQAEEAPKPSKRSAYQPIESDDDTTTSARADATLRINSRPWAQIFVDGKSVGNTPQLALQVSAGHHTVRLVNPELDVSKTFELDAHPGQTLSRVELLTD